MSTTAIVTNVVVAGLGGQGVVKASDIIAAAAFHAGLDVKQSELHGMSQRGGSVSSDIRFGSRVLSPMVPFGEADFLVAIAPDQVEGNRPVLRPGGWVLDPSCLEPARLANARTLNVALVGALSALLSIDEEHWRAALAAKLPAVSRQSNAAAFAIGREAGRRIAAMHTIAPASS